MLQKVQGRLGTCSTIGHVVDECFKLRINQEVASKREQGSLGSKKVVRFILKEKGKEVNEDSSPIKEREPSKKVEDLVQIDNQISKEHIGAQHQNSDKYLSNFVPHVLEEVDADKVAQILSKDGDNVLIGIQVYDFGNSKDLIDDSTSVETIFYEYQQDLPSYVSDSILSVHDGEAQSAIDRLAQNVIPANSHVTQEDSLSVQDGATQSVVGRSVQDAIPANSPVQNEAVANVVTHMKVLLHL